MKMGNVMKRIYHGDAAEKGHSGEKFRRKRSHVLWPFSPVTIFLLSMQSSMTPLTTVSKALGFLPVPGSPSPGPGGAGPEVAVQEGTTVPDVLFFFFL